MGVKMSMREAGNGNQKVVKLGGLQWRFTDKQYTAWGGLRVVEEMLGRIGFSQALRQSGLPQPGSNRGFDPVEVMQSFLVSVWVGGTRFAHTALLRFDAALRQIFGLDQVPSATTFTRFFRRFGRRQVDEVFGYLTSWFWKELQPMTLTLDLDSTVLTRYGQQQEGSVRGYNPHRRGKPCQHPLLAFAAEVRMVVHAWMRPGNTNAGCNAEGFFREVLTVLDGRHKIGLVRADSGFGIGTFLSLLEDKAIHYIVVARNMRTIRRRLTGITNWVEVEPGVSVSELEYEAVGWKKARRLVVVRHRFRQAQGGRTLLEVPGYGYSLYLTNLGLPPMEIRRLYLARADSENRIKELREDFGMGGFMTQNFWATEAAFRAVILAYNLMALFRQVVLKSPCYQMLATLRVQCFAIGASLGRKGHKCILRLGLPPPRRAWFEGLFASASSVVLPFHPKTYAG
jgi:hypothetical protein